MPDRDGMSRETNAETYEDRTGTSSSRVFPLRPHLFVVLECDRPRSGGARHSVFEVDEVVIGRGSERTARRETLGGVRRLTLKIPGRSMSSTHARILQSGGDWILEAARPTN